MSTTESLDLEVGATLEPKSYGPLSRTDIVRYAGASGDFNPIHHDEQFAASAGFPTVFSMGMLQAGILAAYVTERFGPRNIRRFASRFKEQVWPGDTLTCSGTITGRKELDDGTTTIQMELSVTRQTGGVAIAGEAEFVLPG